VSLLNCSIGDALIAQILEITFLLMIGLWTENYINLVRPLIQAILGYSPLVEKNVVLGTHFSKVGWTVGVITYCLYFKESYAMLQRIETFKC